MHVHHTFLSPAGGPNPGKQHFSVKKAPKIWFCAAISHPILVTSTFKMLLKVLKYTLSVLGVILWNKISFCGQEGSKKTKSCHFLAVFIQINVVLGPKIVIFCRFHAKGVILRPKSPPEMEFLFVFLVLHQRLKTIRPS